MRTPYLLRFLIIVTLGVVTAYSQGRGAGGQGATQPPPTARAMAPIDLTGYWVSVTTDGWRYRMLPPPKGDYTGIPLNAEGRKVADAWDPSKDAASGEPCKNYGAPALMRLPGRLHITWQDDNTLKVETDAGTQTRLFSFSNPRAEPGSWQGVSQASWDLLREDAGGNPLRPSGINQGKPLGGSLKVTTTNLKPGYLRTNGVPYSTNAKLTEHFDRFNEPNGDSILIVTATLEDLQYLAGPFRANAQFKKQSDASGWNPVPCGF